MGLEYDDITAFHYASYRPALHHKILKKCLDNESFDLGLDIGCGTGQSSIALANFCNQVYGIDPSRHMISEGIVYKNVRYTVFDKVRIDFDDDTFNIISLAGSLWYAKSQNLLDEICRVANKDALILVYDFEVLLQNFLEKIGLNENEKQLESYNHQEDFSGLNTNGINKINKETSRVSFESTASELAHLILSVKNQHETLAELYGAQNLYERVVDKLRGLNNSKNFAVQANIYFTLYQQRQQGF